MKSIVQNIALAGIIAFVVNPASAHSSTLKPEFVDTLIPAYLEVQRALAGDQFADAQAGAERLLAAVAEGPKMHKLTEAAEAIASASDIAAARASFLVVSNDMIELIDHVGTTDGQDALFVVHCPMAFGGKGGDWLQADRGVLNPYYGARMLRCGRVVRSPEKEKVEGHEGH